METCHSDLDDSLGGLFPLAALVTAGFSMVLSYVLASGDKIP